MIVNTDLTALPEFTFTIQQKKFVGLWSWIADKLHFILSYEANLLQRTPSHLHDYSICNNARLIFAQYYDNMTDLNESEMLMVSLAVSVFKPTTSWLGVVCPNH